MDVLLDHIKLFSWLHEGADGWSALSPSLLWLQCGWRKVLRGIEHLGDRGCSL
jgi:hypothetical protein